MIIVVIGGSGSGKSEFGEDLAVRLNGEKLIYIATMQAFGDEGRKRVERHQRMRRDDGMLYWVRVNSYTGEGNGTFGMYVKPCCQ